MKYELCLYQHSSLQGKCQGGPSIRDDRGYMVKLVFCWLKFKGKCIMHPEAIQDTFTRLDLAGQSQQTPPPFLLKGERYWRQTVLWERLHHYSVKYTILSSSPNRTV